MVHTVYSAALEGLEARPVTVEVAIRRGTPMIGIIGLAPGAARECRERFRAAASHLRLRVPGLRITVNLAPADLRKEGAGFDLAVAVAVLASAGHVPPPCVARWALVGELGLDGSVRGVPGVLPIALRFRYFPGLAGLIVPAANLCEAQPVDGLRVLGARSLADVLGFLRGDSQLSSPGGRVSSDAGRIDSEPDFREIRGQRAAKRALMVAAAGGHNVLLRGAPGMGKTMLARALPSILPPMSQGEALRSTAVHSVAGRLGPDSGLLSERPFRAPHHTVTTAGLIGGGSPVRPGEISLAHNGVLFLDELPEFRAAALEALRQPLEEGVVRISRAHRTVVFPARFMFVAAMNPCRCGRLTDVERRCRCTPGDVRRYVSRLSGPLIDRIDMLVEVPTVSWTALNRDVGPPESRAMRRSVELARERARRRSGMGESSNARMRPGQLRRHCRLDVAGDGLLRTASAKLGLGARGCHRVLRVARTIADLEGEADIQPEHVAEAIRYRIPHPDLPMRGGAGPGDGHRRVMRPVDHQPR